MFPSKLSPSTYPVERAKSESLITPNTCYCTQRTGDISIPVPAAPASALVHFPIDEPSSSPTVNDIKEGQLSSCWSLSHDTLVCPGPSEQEADLGLGSESSAYRSSPHSPHSGRSNISTATSPQTVRSSNRLVPFTAFKTSTSFEQAREARPITVLTRYTIGSTSVSSFVEAFFSKRDCHNESTPCVQTRPSNLPPKNPKEEERQQRMYEEIVRRGRRDEERRQKRQNEREDAISQSTTKWQKELIPNFQQLKDSRRLRECTYQGIPTAVRGTVWQMGIGNSLLITPELYQTHRAKAKAKAQKQRRASMFAVNESSPNRDANEPEPPLVSTYSAREHVVERRDSGNDRANSMALIELDLGRTYPALAFFRKGGPEQETLRNILEAFVCYHPEIGYVQGMSFLVSHLLLNMGEVDAFICFCSLLSRPMMQAFYTMELQLIEPYLRTFESLMLEYLPAIYQHLDRLGIQSDLYMIDWVLTLFSKALPLDIADRLWDLVLLYGDAFVLRSALAIFYVSSDLVLNGDFEDVAKYLTHLPDNLNMDKLMQGIQMIDVSEEKVNDLLVLMK